MTPLKGFKAHIYCDTEVLLEGIFYSNPSFTVPRVRYIINMYSIVNVINIKEALWHSTLRNA